MPTMIGTQVGGRYPFLRLSSGVSARSLDFQYWRGYWRCTNENDVCDSCSSTLHVLARVRCPRASYKGVERLPLLCKVSVRGAWRKRQISPELPRSLTLPRYAPRYHYSLPLKVQRGELRLLQHYQPVLSHSWLLQRWVYVLEPEGEANMQHQSLAEAFWNPPTPPTYGLFHRDHMASASICWASKISARMKRPSRV
jgi:hypothetical protein